MIENKIVYFGSKNNYVYALDVDTGEKIWSFKTLDPVYSYPIVKNGTLYVAAADLLYALDAKTGAVKWKYLSWNRFSTVISLRKDILYAGTSFGMIALDISNGKVIWESSYKIVTGQTVFDEFLYFMDYEGIVYALDAKTGNMKWKSEMKVRGIQHSTPVVSDGVLYFSAPSSDKLFAIDPKTGKILWEIGIDIYSSHGDASPTVYNKIIYMSGTNLYAVDTKDGAVKWKVNITGSVSSPTCAGKIVYAANWHTDFYAINLDTQKIIWTFKAREKGGTYHSSPCVLMKDGSVKYPSANGMIQ